MQAELSQRKSYCCWSVGLKKCYRTRLKRAEAQVDWRRIEHHQNVLPAGQRRSRTLTYGMVDEFGENKRLQGHTGISKATKPFRRDEQRCGRPKNVVKRADFD